MTTVYCLFDLSVTLGDGVEKLIAINSDPEALMSKTVQMLDIEWEKDDDYYLYGQSKTLQYVIMSIKPFTLDDFNETELVNIRKEYRR